MDHKLFRGGRRWRTNLKRPKARAVSFNTLVALWRDVSLFAAAFAYLAGWTYIRSYYRAFEIDPNILDVAINNYFVYAFFALLTGWGVALVIALLSTAAIVHRLGGHKLVYTAVLLAFAFGLFHVSRAQGAQDGRSLRARFQELPAVTFTFKDPNLEARIAANPEWTGTWFLVTATKDKYMVLVQKTPDPMFPDRWPAATTLVIPASEAIASIRLKDITK